MTTEDGGEMMKQSSIRLKRPSSQLESAPPAPHRNGIESLKPAATDCWAFPSLLPGQPAQGMRGFKSLVPPPKGGPNWITDKKLPPVRMGTQLARHSPPAPVRATDDESLGKLPHHKEKSTHEAPKNPAPEPDERLKFAREAVEKGEFEDLCQFDEQLGEVVEHDEVLEVDLAEDGFVDKEAGKAMKLCAKGMTLLDSCVWTERKKQAFKAIAQDDTVALKTILDVCGSDFREYKNAAGESLLEFATDRKKDKTKTMLLAALIPASARSKKYSTFMPKMMGKTIDEDMAVGKTKSRTMRQAGDRQPRR